MSADMAAVVLVWVVGAVVGWCAGWVVRGEQNRARSRSLAGQLRDSREQLGAAWDELDSRRESWHAQRVAPSAPVVPAVVHVHVAAPLPPTALRLVAGPRVLDPVPAAEQVQP